MRIKLLYLFLFLIANLFLVLLHLWIFRGSQPFAAWLTGGVHILLLFLFPYKKLYFHDNK